MSNRYTLVARLVPGLLLGAAFGCGTDTPTESGGGAGAGFDANAGAFGLAGAGGAVAGNVAGAADMNVAGMATPTAGMSSTPAAGTGATPEAGAGPAAGTANQTAGAGAGNDPAPSAGAANPMAGAGSDPTPMAGAGMDTAGAGGDPVAGATGDGTPTACTITFDSVETSSKIPTVGIVEWSTDLAGLSDARIEFGLDTTYGLSAPVDLSETGLRTLLLGMKANQTYNFRVVATANGMTCTSENQTIQTGDLDSGLPDIEVDTPGASYGGFIVTGTYQTGPAYILDADRDFVWWYGMGEVTRARMSYDGKYMWMEKGNVPASAGAKVIRVTMDGLEADDMTQQFNGANHDLAPTEDGGVIFFAYGTSSTGANCDDIKEWKDGNVRTIVNAGDAHGVSGGCHLNAIHVDRTDGNIVFSDLDHNLYAKVDRETGATIWVLGGTNSDFAGDGSSWNAQHGFHLLPDDHILIFNNRGNGGGMSSLALEMDMDLNAMTSTLVWQYASSPGINNQVMGDVQRLANGNTLITYSTQGIAHEVNPDGQVMQTLSWGLGGAVGYAMVRDSLYGPPPK